MTVETDYYPIIWDNENRIFLCNVCRLGSLHATKELTILDTPHNNPIYQFLNNKEDALEHFTNFHNITLNEEQVEQFLDNMQKVKEL